MLKKKILLNFSPNMNLLIKFQRLSYLAKQKTKNKASQLRTQIKRKLEILQTLLSCYCSLVSSYNQHLSVQLYCGYRSADRQSLLFTRSYYQLLYDPTLSKRL